MSIFLTGASGTGKTTVGRLLAEHYDLELQASLSRTSPHEIGSEAHQKYISQKMYELAMAEEIKVFDRTPLDVVGYDLTYGFAELAVDSMLNALFWMKTDPIIIYFPVYWEPEDDGVRPTDQRTTELVDISIRSQLENSKLDYLVMPNVDPESRLELAVEFINSKREMK